jgi:hypothetical protein
MTQGESSWRRKRLSVVGILCPIPVSNCPLNPIAEGALSNRNTFIRAYFNTSGALTSFEKVVYGEVELAHRYEYYDNGILKCAVITMLEEDPVVMSFDETGVHHSEV